MARALALELAKACEQFSSDPAVMDESGSLSYSEFADQAERWATSLRASELSEHEPVIVRLAGLWT